MNENFSQIINPTNKNIMEKIYFSETIYNAENKPNIL